jgi:hypothetical protein
MSELAVVLLGLRLSGSVVTIAAIILAGCGELLWLFAARAGASGSGSGLSARSGSRSLPAADPGEDPASSPTSVTGG